MSEEILDSQANSVFGIFRVSHGIAGGLPLLSGSCTRFRPPLLILLRCRSRRF